MAFQKLAEMAIEVSRKANEVLALVDQMSGGGPERIVELGQAYGETLRTAGHQRNYDLRICYWCNTRIAEDTLERFVAGERYSCDGCSNEVETPSVVRTRIPKADTSEKNAPPVAGEGVEKIRELVAGPIAEILGATTDRKKMRSYGEGGGHEKRKNESAVRGA